MTTQHTKSSCCRASIRRYGERRWQCIKCLRTWRIYQKKRGRKHLRPDQNLLERTFLKRQRLSNQLHWYYQCSYSVLQKRFQRNLLWFVNKPGIYPLFTGPLVLLGDGLVFYFKKHLWTLYIMAIKPVQSEKAFLLDPILLPGSESFKRWVSAIATIPRIFRKRIKAFVSDNFTASHMVVRNFGFLHQLCHFHLLMELQRRRGKRKIFFLKDCSIREEIYQTIRNFLTVKSERKLTTIINRLLRLAAQSACPKKLRMIINETIRRQREYRAYLQYPELDLPHTTNAVESVGKMIRSLTSTLRTPKALSRWSKGFVRLHPYVICNGQKNRNYQPN